MSETKRNNPRLNQHPPNEDGANAVVAPNKDGANAAVAPKEDTAISADSSKEEKTTSEKRRDKQRRKKIFRIIRRILFALFILAMLAAFIGFIYFRWMMHDDATDIEGKWRLAGSETPVVIEKGRFVLTDEIVYDYTIDPDAKTIAFEFGALNGKARYRFSVDRNMLAIQDGEFDWGGNLSNDIGWTIDALLNELQGNPTKSPELAEGGMVLERIQ